MQSNLLSPYQLTPKLTLKNRIVMAPMTRRQATSDFTLEDVMIDYYAKRAAAGLIVTEGTLISADGIGYGYVPGIFKQKHIDQWSRVTNAVHEREGKIFLQLWHCGRISHKSFHQGKYPLSASATTPKVTLGSTKLSASPSRAASKFEIEKLITDFANAAKNAITAGFDGIEIHGANGYLIDQFLHFCSNHRDDEYGVTFENLARFAYEVVVACAQIIGNDKVGIRLSPAGHMNDIVADARDKFVFKKLFAQLEPLKIAYIHTGTFNDFIKYPELEEQTMSAFIRKNYRGSLIACGAYDFTSANASIENNNSDLIAFGKPFIANPNLINILEKNLPQISFSPHMLNDIN